MDGRAEWPQPLTREFIRVYRDSECLWLTTSPEYKNRFSRDRAHADLLEVTTRVFPDADLNVVRRKINILRTMFRKEHKKVLKSIQDGGDGGFVYEPKLWCYQDLSFLGFQESQEFKLMEYSSPTSKFTTKEENYNTIVLSPSEDIKPDPDAIQVEAYQAISPSLEELSRSQYNIKLVPTDVRGNKEAGSHVSLGNKHQERYTVVAHETDGSTPQANQPPIHAHNTNRIDLQCNIGQSLPEMQQTTNYFIQTPNQGSSTLDHNSPELRPVSSSSFRMTNNQRFVTSSLSVSMARTHQPSHNLQSNVTNALQSGNSDVSTTKRARQYHGQKDVSDTQYPVTMLPRSREAHQYTGNQEPYKRQQNEREHLQTVYNVQQTNVRRSSQDDNRQRKASEITQQQLPRALSSYESTYSSETEDEVFARMVAMELNKMNDSRQKLFVKKLINDALFQGHLKGLNLSSKIVTSDQIIPDSSQ